MAVVQSLPANIPFELSALAQATRYNAWVASAVHAFLGQRLIELGAGIGNISLQLPQRELLLLTETEPTLLNVARQRLQQAGKGAVQSLRFDLLRDPAETLAAFQPDTLLSFNVLEHIEDHAQALAKQAQILRLSRATGPKRIVALVPAHNWAYGEIDRHFGHYRRYSRAQLRDLSHQVLPEARFQMRSFNPVGLFGWWWTGNVRKIPSIPHESIRLSEFLQPLMSVVDQAAAWLHVPLGQSLIAVWEF